MTQYIIQRQKRQAKYFTEDLGNGIGLDMILIPEGTFLMGSPESELESLDNEAPQHQVKVSAFFLGRYPITQVQWKYVATFQQPTRKLNPDPSFFKGDNRPVEKVSWFDAVEFCDRLSRHTNRTYRLPSEAEWEYACRAGTTTPFHFGNTITSELANYNSHEVYGNSEVGEYRDETTPVDFFDVANDFGLSDMHGNVFEWCLDHWHKNYKGAPEDGGAWLTDNEESDRIIRGGSWFLNPGLCRSAYRVHNKPDSDSDPIGFRVVCEMPLLSSSRVI